MSNLLEMLAAEIEAKFTPTVFRCSCGGEDASCRRILQDNISGVWQTKDAVDSIAHFLRTYQPTTEETE